MSSITPEERRKKLLEKMQKRELPMLPDVFSRLVEMASDLQVSLEDLAAAVRYDPALTSRLLKVANGAAVGGAVPASTVEEAVLRLGLRETKYIILSLSLIASIPRGGALDYRQFWKHSLAVGFAVPIVEKMSPKVGTPSPEGFTCGLLHDLGIFVLDQCAPGEYAAVTRAAESGRELWEVEREYFGIDHAEVGAMLMRRWKLPEIMVSAVAYHHKPLEAPLHHALVTKAVHLANFACANQGVGNGLQKFAQKFSEAAWFDMGVGVDRIPEIIEQTHRQAESAQRVLKVAL